MGILTLNGEEVRLQLKAIAVLKLFVSRPGEILSRQNIKEAVWKGESVVDNSVDQRVTELRRTFEAGDPGFVYIETRPKQGWRFVCPVITVEPSAVAVESIEPSVIDEIPRGQPLPPDGRKPESRSRLLLSASVIGPLVLAAGTLVLLPRLEKAHGAVEVRITGFTPLTHDGRVKQGELASDRKLLYFIEFPRSATDGERVQAAVPLLGQARVDFPPPPSSGLLLVSIASNGERVFIDWRDKLGRTFLQRTPSAPLEPLGAASGRTRISSDGHWVAKTVSGVLSIRNVDSGLVNEVELPGMCESVAWRPDSDSLWVSVVDAMSEVSSLWEVYRDGRQPKHLPFAFLSKVHVEGAWTSDGKTYVFCQSHAVGARSDLWTTSADGNGGWQAPALVESELSLTYPTVARDDSAILAVGSELRDESVKYDAERREFAPIWGGIPATDVAFSHDAKRVAYVLYPELTLWISNADGSDRRQVTHSPLAVNQPHWAPDDTEITFTAQMPSDPWRNYAVPASSDRIHEIAPGFPLEPGPASWSADGRYMVFGERKGRHAAEDMELHLFEVAHGSVSTLPGSRGKWSPRWSPDGRFILAISSDLGTLWIFDCTRQKWSLLAAMRNIESAEWSPDSKFIQFTAISAEKSGIFRAYPNGGSVDRVSDLPQQDNYVFAGIAPDGSPIVMRQVRTDEIYRINWKRTVRAPQK